MDYKRGLGIIKDLNEGDGTGTAVFATLGVIDRDGDVTNAGAFGTQNAKLVGAHRWEKPSIGTSKIYEKGNEALADFRFNLTIKDAQEWYSSLKDQKAHDVEQQWSYGFDVLESSNGEHEQQRVRFLKKMKVHEVSPVMIGAGQGTRLLDIKGLKMPFEDHGSGVLDVVNEYILRVEEIRELRESEGKKNPLSAAALAKIKSLHEGLNVCIIRLDTLLVPGDDGLSVEAQKAELQRLGLKMLKDSAAR